MHSSHGYLKCEHSIILMYQYPGTGPWALSVNSPWKSQSVSIGKGQQGANKSLKMV